MNGSQAESAKMLAGIKQGLSSVKKAQVVVCPHEHRELRRMDGPEVA